MALTACILATISGAEMADMTGENGSALQQDLMARVDSLPDLAPVRRGSPAAGDAGSGSGSDYAPAPAPAPQSMPTYRPDMSWGDYATGALGNAPASGAKVLGGIYNAVTHLPETGDALAQLGVGALSKVNTALGGRDRSEQGEKAVDAFVNDIKGRWADPAKSFYEDPFGIGMDVASIAPVVGTAGRLGGLGSVATAAEKVAALGDPVNLALQGARLTTKGATLPVTTLGRYAQGAASNTPLSALKLAEKTGASADPVARSTFLAFNAGKGELRDMARAATEAMKEKMAALSDHYTTQKRALTTQPLSLADVRQTVDDLRQQLDPFGHRANMPDLAILNQMDAHIRQWEANPNPAARTAVELDRLKRDLNSMVMDAPPSERGALAIVPRSVKNTIAQVDGTYADMMEFWQNWMRRMKDFESTLGTSDRVSETNQIARLMSTLKNDSKMSLLQELADTPSGKYLPQMIAGAATSKWMPPYLQGMGLGVIGSALAGGPHGVAAIAGGSPRLAGLTQYGAGRLEGAINAIPTPPSAVANAASQIGQDRVERKSGGRVGIDHDRMADQLVGAAERAKKGISRSTEQLLDLPDDHIAHALEVANRSI